MKVQMLSLCRNCLKNVLDFIIILEAVVYVDHTSLVLLI